MMGTDRTNQTLPAEQSLTGRHGAKRRRHRDGACQYHVSKALGTIWMLSTFLCIRLEWSACAIHFTGCSL